jgi:hypothetical protein
MAILYDPSAAGTLQALLGDAARAALAGKVLAALEALNSDPRDERFRRRSYAPSVDWGFVVRTRDEELLILWHWDSDENVPRVRYVGPDL